MSTATLRLSTFLIYALCTAEEIHLTKFCYECFKGRFPHSMPCPCRYGFRLCLSHLISQCGLVWFTLSMPLPCSDHAGLVKATAQRVRRQTAFGLPACVRFLPATMRRSTKVIRSITISDAGVQCETKRRLSWKGKRVVAAHYKKDDLLNCWTSCSDISGYHEDFHEGSALCEHCRGAAWHVWIDLYLLTYLLTYSMVQSPSWEAN